MSRGQERVLNLILRTNMHTRTIPTYMRNKLMARLSLSEADAAAVSSSWARLQSAISCQCDSSCVFIYATIEAGMMLAQASNKATYIFIFTRLGEEIIYIYIITPHSLTPFPVYGCAHIILYRFYAMHRSRFRSDFFEEVRSRCCRKCTAMLYVCTYALFAMRILATHAAINALGRIRHCILQI